MTAREGYSRTDQVLIQLSTHGNKRIDQAKSVRLSRRTAIVLMDGQSELLPALLESRPESFRLYPDMVVGPTEQEKYFLLP